MSQESDTIANKASEFLASQGDLNIKNMIIDNLHKNEVISSIIEFFKGRWMGDSLELLIKLAIALVIYMIGMFIARRLLNIVEKLMKQKKIDSGLRSFVYSFCEAIFKIVVILAVLSSLGFNIGSLMAIFAAAGVAIGLALKDSLSNIAAGVLIITLKPFKTDDYVEAAGIDGIVESISVFTTNFRTFDNKQISVPNAHITAGSIVNYSSKPTRRVDMVVGIAYGDDYEKARGIINGILAADSRVLKSPEPTVALDAFADSSVNIVVRPWVKSADYWPFKWDFLAKLKVEFDQQGINFPFPQRDVYVHQISQ